MLQSLQLLPGGSRDETLATGTETHTHTPTHTHTLSTHSMGPEGEVRG